MSSSVTIASPSKKIGPSSSSSLRSSQLPIDDSDATSQLASPYKNIRNHVLHAIKVPNHPEMSSKAIAKPSVIYDTNDTGLPGINYQKIIDLFENRHSRNIYERHMAVLHKLCLVYQTEMTLNDFQNLPEIINSCLNKINSRADILVEPLFRLLNICYKSIHVIRGLDEPCVGQMLLSMAEIVNLRMYEGLLESASEILYVLCGGNDFLNDSFGSDRIGSSGFSAPGRVSHLLPPITHHDDEVKINKIFGPATTSLVKAFRIHFNTPNAVSIIHILKKLSTSSICAREMLQGQLLHDILEILRRLGDEFLIFSAIEILWNMLESDVGKEVAYLMSNTDSMNSLREIYVYLSARLKRQVYKQMRNEIILIVHLTTNLNHASIYACLETGLLREIYHSLTAMELGEEGDRHLGNYEPFGQDDYEFKRAGIYLLHSFLTESVAAQYLIEKQFIEYLILYLNFNPEQACIKRWSLWQLKTFQLQCLQILPDILSHPNAQSRAVSLSRSQLLQNYLKEADLKDNGKPNGYEHSKEEIIGLVPSCLRLITSLATASDENKGSFGLNGTIETIVGKCLMK